MDEETNFTNADRYQPYKPRRLNKVTKNAWLAGVCIGLANYLGINVIFIRIVFSIFSLLSGWGLFFYIVLALLLKPDFVTWQEKDYNKKSLIVFHQKSITATLLLLSGAYFFLNDLNVYDLFGFFNLNNSITFCILLFFVGIYFIKENDVNNTSVGSGSERFQKYNSGKRIAGVCIGLGKYLNVDATTVRMLWLLSAFATLGITAFIYILLSFVLPYAKEELEVEE